MHASSLALALVVLLLASADKPNDRSFDRVDVLSVSLLPALHSPQSLQRRRLWWATQEQKKNKKEKKKKQKGKEQPKKEKKKKKSLPHHDC